MHIYIQRYVSLAEDVQFTWMDASNSKTHRGVDSGTLSGDNRLKAECHMFRMTSLLSSSLGCTGNHRKHAPVCYAHIHEDNFQGSRFIPS